MGEYLNKPRNAFGEPRSAERRPVVGVVCCNRVMDGRQAQVVASRFLQPLRTIANAALLLVPALPELNDARQLAGLLDGLLLTGSCSNLSAARYGQEREETALDEGRDEVALRLAAAMIEAGRPVFGICRGLQELNVLFGGTLAPDVGPAGHHGGFHDGELEALFGHGHDVSVSRGGILAQGMGAGRHRVNSVHQQGIERLGSGLTVEARAHDGLIEAISARPLGGQVLGVQWHPEWDVEDNRQSRGFFELLNGALREQQRAAAF